MAYLENQFQHLSNEVHHLRGIVAQPPLPPPPHVRPNLNLPHTPQFFGVPSELLTFKLKHFQFLIENHNTYSDNQSQLLYAGILLTGSVLGLLPIVTSCPLTSTPIPHCASILVFSCASSKCALVLSILPLVCVYASLV